MSIIIHRRGRTTEKTAEKNTSSGVSKLTTGYSVKKLVQSTERKKSKYKHIYQIHNILEKKGINILQIYSEYYLHKKEFKLWGEIFRIGVRKHLLIVRRARA